MGTLTEGFGDLPKRRAYPAAEAPNLTTRVPSLAGMSRVLVAMVDSLIDPSRQSVCSRRISPTRKASIPVNLLDET